MELFSINKKNLKNSFRKVAFTGLADFDCDSSQVVKLQIVKKKKKITSMRLKVSDGDDILLLWAVRMVNAEDVIN